MTATITCAEVAKELGLAPRTVSVMIERGELPIGVVYLGGSRRRTIIPKERYEAWKKGRDLGGQANDL